MVRNLYENSVLSGIKEFNGILSLSIFIVRYYSMDNKRDIKLSTISIYSVDVTVNEAVNEIWQNFILDLFEVDTPNMSSNNKQ